MNGMTKEASCRVAALGLFVLHLAWAISLPAFRGVDEFDHVYRAAAVAHGQVIAPPTNATRGTGAWLIVPDDIVAAARQECERLSYTKAVDCRPSRVDGDMVTVASGAGRYIPVYYLAIGWVTWFAEGDTAVVLMRGLTSLACILLFYIALRSVRMASTGNWPALGTLIAVSPVAVYSGSIVAPNGVEIMAGLAVWAGLTAGLRSPELLTRGPLLKMLVIAGCLLALLRQLGPFWLMLIALMSLLACSGGLRILGELLKTGRGRLAASFVVSAVFASSAWTILNRSLVIGRVENTVSYQDLLQLLPSLNLLWLLQSIAAFPTRSDRAPTAVYACFGLLWILVMLVALSMGSRRPATVGVLVAVSAVLVANLVTFATFKDFAASWQGRYALPLSVGASLLAGWSLDSRYSGAVRWRQFAPVSALFVLGQVLGLAHILLKDMGATSASALSDGVRLVGLTILAITGAFTMIAAIGMHQPGVLSKKRPRAFEKSR